MGSWSPTELDYNRNVTVGDILLLVLGNILVPKQFCFDDIVYISPFLLSALCIVKVRYSGGEGIAKNSTHR